MNKNADATSGENEEEEILPVQEEADEQDNSDGEETSEEEQNSEGDASEGEDETGDEGEDSEDSDEEDPEEENLKLRDKLRRANSQIERLKNAKASSRKEAGKEVGSEGSVKDTEKALLAAYGHKDKSDQIAIGELARKAGVTISEALDDSFIMDRFEHNKKQQQVRRAASRPDSKGKTGTKGVNFYIQRNIIPKDQEMASKVRAELSRRSQEGNS